MRMERRVPMGASKLLASAMLALAGGVCLVAQDAAPAAASPSPQASSSSFSQSHRSAHPIQVRDDDSPTQPAELTAAEAAIEKNDYAAAEPLLRKFVEHDSTNYVGWFDL